VKPLDLLVLGGGPAGAAIAALAAERGARVLVVDRDRFPRDKVCGEFLSVEGQGVLERLGVMRTLLAAGAVGIARSTITSRAGRAVDAPLPDLPGIGREALGVSRRLLDATLVDRARALGAVVRERCEAVVPLLEDGRVAGARLRGVGRRDEGEDVVAALVIGADGRRSALARALHPSLGDPPRCGPRSWFGLEVHLEGGFSVPRDRVELHLFDGGYAGIGPVEGGRVDLCFIVRVAALRACGGSPERVVRERILANPAARRSLAGTTPCSSWKSVGPLRFGPRRPTAAGALFVGDAAGTIDPFCGEGISNALKGAEVALPFALYAAARGGLGKDAARGYERAWRAAFVPVTRRARAIGFLFGHAVVGDLVLALLRGPARPLIPALVATTRTGV
jgi:flavin-dependent dehydrogenase